VKLIVSVSLLASAIVIAGCGGTDSGAIPSTGPSVAVIYESNPLADVQVRLHAGPTGPVITQSISAADGTARFSGVPSPEPDEYFVSLESLSDGGWMLDAKYSQAADSGMTLKPLVTNDGQRIEIPSGAVRSLNINNRR